MAAVLMLDGVAVAEWSAPGAPPWPISFQPDNVGTARRDSWPIDEQEGEPAPGENVSSTMYRGSPAPIENLGIIVPFYIYRRDYSGVAGGNPPWGGVGNTRSISSAVATRGSGATGNPAGDPLPMHWTNIGSIVYAPTTIAALRSEDAAVGAVMEVTQEPYASGAPLVEGANVVITATPLADGEGHDGSTLPSLVFWKWICAETLEEFTTSQITVPAPDANTVRTYTAYWRPKSVQLVAEAGDNGTEVDHLGASGLYYSKEATGEPEMPVLFGRVIEGQESERSFRRWMKTVYSISEATGELVPGIAEEVESAPDPEYSPYVAVQTVRETAELAAQVVYQAFTRETHDRVAVSVSNTYLLKGAGYTKTPAGAVRFGEDGYAGEYSLEYNQPDGVTYTVRARKAGDLTAGVVNGADAGAFEDSNTGKLWRAAYVLFAVDAEGEPVGPGEDITVPEDPDLPELPGGGGSGGDDGGAGTPVGTGLSLQIVSEDFGVTAGTANLALGSSVIMSVTHPGEPLAVKSATQGAVYILTVSGLAPSLAVVRSVTANGTAIVSSGGKWPVVAGTGATSVVVTLGFPDTKFLQVSAISVPSGESPANAVTVSPAAHFPPDRWLAGTNMRLTAVPSPGYTHVLWRRDDAAGGVDEDPGGSDYAFALNADTVVTAGFSKPTLDVVLTVKGSEALAAMFDWTAEASDAGDTVPAEHDPDLFTGGQLGIFKIGSAKVQTAGDASYNTYVDMPVAGVDISYDGGATWEDAGGAYPALYNAQSSPRAARRIGKHTVSRAPLDDKLHVRIRLTATVSVSVGMPPVKWDGGKADSMIGTGQNNWGCGFGIATVSHSVGGVEVSAAMSYPSTHPLALLTASQASPYPDYFSSYPYFEVELGETVSAVAAPAAGFYFVAWIDGYFSHTWENTAVPLASEERLVWPAAHYISTDPTADIVVDQGIKKIMLRMRSTVAPRYVLFTHDSGEVLAVRPSTGLPEKIVPSITWAAYLDDTSDANRKYLMRFTPYSPASKIPQTGSLFSALLTSWGVTSGTLEALGITSANSRVWLVNRDNSVTTIQRLAFTAYLSWAMSGNPMFVGGDPHQAYLGVYRRVHLNDKNGAHQVGPWEFVGRGDGYTDWEEATYLTSNLGQNFTANIEYRVRWDPYVEPTEPDEEYQVTVGYQEEEDRDQGVVSATIEGVPTGEINARIRTEKVQPGDTVVITAVARKGFSFVSWVNGEGEAVTTSPVYTIDPDTDGYIFLANFTPDIVEPPTTTKVFHVGFVTGNAGRGSILVRIWRADTTVEDYTVTAAGGADYQLFAGDNAYVVAVPGEGWQFGGWNDSYGNPRGAVAGYYPLADAGTAGSALHRDVYFAAPVVPPVTGNVPFRAGFLNPADIPHALLLVSVNGALLVVLNGLQHVDMMLTEGDTVAVEPIVTPGFQLTGYVTPSYVAAASPSYVQAVAVLNQGLLVVLGLAPPPPEPVPDVTPGTPVTGAGLWLFDAGTVNKGFVWRSRRFEVPLPVEFNSARVSRNGSLFPTSVALRVNAYSSPETTAPTSDIDIVVTSDAPRRLPKIRKERYFEVEVTAKDDIDCVKVATSMGELQNG